MLTDTRRSSGRNADGQVVDADGTSHWLGAIGYLTVIDQLSKLLDVPHLGAGFEAKGQTAYERLLVWDAALLPDEAAAIYALRCAFVHSFGLVNEYESKDAERRRVMRHGFRLTATGQDVVRLGARRQAADCPLSELPPTEVDLWSLGDTVERLIADLRKRHLGGAGLHLKPKVTLDTFRLGGFFFHQP